MVLLPFDHEETGKLFLECPVFEALRSTLSLGLVDACYGECILNTVAPRFRATSLMDGDLYLSSSRCIDSPRWEHTFTNRSLVMAAYVDLLCCISHSLIWRPSRVADTPPLLPISRYGYLLFVADVCLCSEVLQPGGSWSSSGSGSM